MVAVTSQAPGSHPVGPKRAMDRNPHTMARTPFSSPEANIVVCSDGYFDVYPSSDRANGDKPAYRGVLAELGAGIRGGDDRLAVRPSSVALAEAVSAWSGTHGAAAVRGDLGRGRDGNQTGDRGVRSIMDDSRARERIAAERLRVEAALADLDVAVATDGPLGAQQSDRSDSGSELTTEMVDVALRDRLRVELAAIERAEERIRAGTTVGPSTAGCRSRPRASTRSRSPSVRSRSSVPTRTVDRHRRPVRWMSSGSRIRRQPSKSVVQPRPDPRGGRVGARRSPSICSTLLRCRCSTRTSRMPANPPLSRRSPPSDGPTHCSSRRPVPTTAFRVLKNAIDWASRPRATSAHLDRPVAASERVRDGARPPARSSGGHSWPRGASSCRSPRAPVALPRRTSMTPETSSTGDPALRGRSRRRPAGMGGADPAASGGGRTPQGRRSTPGATPRISRRAPAHAARRTAVTVPASGPSTRSHAPAPFGRSLAPMATSGATSGDSGIPTAPRSSAASKPRCTT